MPRTVVVAAVAGLIVVTSLAASVSFPRFDCPEGFRLVVDTDHSRSDADLICEEGDPMLTLPDNFAGVPGSRLADVSDRLWIKVAIPIAGLVLGASLFAIACAKFRRPSSFDPRAWE